MNEQSPLSVESCHRILWNRRPTRGMRGDNGDIDEVVISHPQTVHIEQMDGRCWWIGIYLANECYWMGNFVADSRGRMRFSEQENAGITWAHDATHETTQQPAEFDPAIVDQITKTAFVTLGKGYARREVES